MKVLTIKEPWASLIINGYKVYEFRNFKTNYRGKILIHAGLTLEKNNAIKFNNYNLDYGKGEIIGEAYITDCILVDDEFENKLADQKLTAIMNYPDIHKDVYVDVAHWIYNRSAQLVAASLLGLIQLLRSYNKDIQK